MSSGFVSGGTIDEPSERDDEWRRAQQDIEDTRRRKQELGRQDGGKSLFEVLQQNKVAKQEAFEESIRLKNQFRSLDEDEVEFLDSLLESTRAKEAAVKKETAEHLAEYQRQREEAERALIEDPSGGQKSSGGGSNLPRDDEEWIVGGKKRKRSKKEILIPPKMRKLSSTIDNATSLEMSTAKPASAVSGGAEKNLAAPGQAKHTSDTNLKGQNTPDKKKLQQKAASTSSLGLVAYNSDEDSE